MPVQSRQKLPNCWPDHICGLIVNSRRKKEVCHDRNDEVVHLILHTEGAAGSTSIHLKPLAMKLNKYTNNTHMIAADTLLSFTMI